MIDNYIDENQLVHNVCAMTLMYHTMETSNQCPEENMKSVFHSLSLAFDDYLSESGLTEKEAIRNVLTFLEMHFLMHEEVKDHLINILLAVEDYIEMLDPDN